MTDAIHARFENPENRTDATRLTVLMVPKG